MILRCDSCKGTEFEIEAFELVRRTYDSADVGDEWKQSEPLEEDYIVSAECADCGKKYPPDLFGLGANEFRKRVRELGRQGMR
jgi:hypothetical protein